MLAVAFGRINFSMLHWTRKIARKNRRMRSAAGMRRSSSRDIGVCLLKLPDPLKGSEECDEVLLLGPGQLRAKDQVEELDCVVQRQQTTVMHVRRRVLDAAQRERLDRPVPCFPRAVDHRRLEKALDLEIVHQVIGVVGRGVAGTALALAEEDLLPAQLGGGGFAWVELSQHVELWRRWESQHLLELGHDVDLMTALE